jgi:hypothetical protein
MSNSNKPIEASVMYQQLSEDWRNRDRLTWQMPAYLVVIGTALLVAAFQEPLAESLRKTILVIGLLFSWILAIFLTRNIYLQALGQTLLDDIITSGKLSLKVKKCAKRVPLHTEEYSFKKAFFDLFTPVSSCSLLLLSSAIAGIFFFLVWGNNRNVWFLWGLLFSLVNTVWVLGCSHYFVNNYKKNWTWQTIGKGFTLAPTLALFVFALLRVVNMLDP